jgi:hypothetical protein
MDVRPIPFCLEMNQGNMTMAESQKEAPTAPKKKIARCDKICKFVGRDSRCKSKCSREPGHILNCKCRTHEMQ